MRRFLCTERGLDSVALLVVLAGLKLAIHFTFNGAYGFQRDELYFIDCGERLAAGYVDAGPLTPWLGRLARELIADSMFGLRFFPAVFGAATVVLVGLITRRLGGKLYAQGLAALAFIIGPVWLGSGNLLSQPSFEPFFWSACALVLIVIIQTENSRLWLLFGLIAGLGTLNKPSMLFYGGALMLGLLLTPQRKWFRDPWLYAAGAVALAAASPFLLWNATHGWATLEFMAKLNESVMSRISPVEFLLGQVLYVHPLNLPIWLAGLYFFVRSQGGRPYRCFGWAYLVLLVFFTLVKSKIYYLSPIYPMLLAGGAVIIEQWVRQHRPARWLKSAAPVSMALGGAFMAPVVLPVLPIEKVDSYVGACTMGLLKNAYEATQTLHDLVGWEEQVQVVAGVYQSLTPEDQAQCVLYGPNFGRAGALNYFGGKYGLPKAHSQHQSYWFWGPPDKPGTVLISVGGEIEDLALVYEDIQEAAVIECPNCVSYEQRVPVYLCRKPRMTLQQVWPMLREDAFRN